MFQTAAYIQRRTGPLDLGRFQYLQLLVCEYEASLTHSDLPLSAHQRHEALTRLSNFAYDPINYDFLWDLNVADLFLDAIHVDAADPLAREYAMGGLCNFCLDPRVQAYLLDADGLRIVIECLGTGSITTVLSALSILWFVSQCGHFDQIASNKPLIEYVKQAAALDMNLSKVVVVEEKKSRDYEAEVRQSVIVLAQLCVSDWHPQIN
ncbi:hypothetical protein BASA50_008196 [Batrachochytrium salamandrivorans]|uniref:Armadillo repeat-containing protein 7 n=1 Tax=Batrachochytrium salamandrivorans TaxID=1357716 RepID=A0ABQ8F4V1_9FUNG|nr:hypothetical protein BASA50_008196 [Batrachochytrium salamandrivorans]KAH6598822.1 hypothetical protein BASA61_002758 [Batrachochytrium salamandrivorans]KAH9274731.1 hypothetical protein BASA83_002935 [Batrachochytrium salamandrivorans]